MKQGGSHWQCEGEKAELRAKRVVTDLGGSEWQEQVTRLAPGCERMGLATLRTSTFYIMPSRAGRIA